ncbi:MAG: hypothetical protein PSY12_08630, partial [bacterium]|nr:hypothetical protein [bacterium]
MNGISSIERALLDHVATAPMLPQVQAWAAVNSGSRNLDGLATTATMLADAFSVLPGPLALIDAMPVDTVSPDGRIM